MPLVRVRTFLGKKLLGEPTRPYAAETTVKAVVDRAIEPLEGIELIDTVDVYKDAAEKSRTAQLPAPARLPRWRHRRRARLQ